MSRILRVGGTAPSIDPGAFVAPGATIAGDVRLAAGVSVWFGCVLRCEEAPIEIGADTNIQDLTVVHTDADQPTIIGARVTVGHRATLHGCVIEDDALIGMGAVVLNGARIGAGAVVAAGAVVREGQHVPPGTLAVGVPAKVLEREVPPVPRPNVATYLGLAERYRHVEVVEEP
ncbi:MAG: gamma carbonic anhydrase family protein [Nitriliruptoraceae bacterium]|nr:gamma carbonic anhydrase family protein [Nitriliruptoraceae bacterium]